MVIIGFQEGEGPGQFRSVGQSLSDGPARGLGMFFMLRPLRLWKPSQGPVGSAGV